MKKKIKIISIFIFSILLVSCGFKQINQNNKNLIYIQKINIIGERRISYILKNNILLISDKNSKNKYQIEIAIKQKKSNKIINAVGKVTRYNLSITTDVNLKNIDNKENINKTFSRSNTYNVSKDHSDTINNEKNSVKNIIQQLSDDIINFITLLNKN
mgnify:CR=1 FL=1